MIKDITKQLQDIHAEAQELTADRSSLEITAASLWCEVIDGKLHKEAGVKSMAEYISLVGAGITRQYVYSLADCHRCGPVRDSYTLLGPNKGIAIAKAYKQDKITWDDALEIVGNTISQDLTVGEVKRQLAGIIKATQEDSQQDTGVKGLLEEKEELLKEQAILEARLLEIKTKLVNIETRILEGAK